jgi:hypothetical protein
MRTYKLHAYSVKYGFNQSLSAPAERAFEWCTDYRPDDLATMREAGRRTIRRIASDSIILMETIPKRNGAIRRAKLVRLNRPELSWISTHISGPNRHSQFLYRLAPEGKTRCRLYFKGLLVCYSRKPLTGLQLLKIGREERRADSTAWRHLAAALRKENNR